ncbi:MAG: anhydro-N-acetylmuramic acid kinase [Pseudomonadota bacterium]
MRKTGLVRVAGAMSGTSLDGVDAAIIETDGIAVASTGPSRYRAYSDTERSVLRAGLGTWPGEPAAQAAARVVEAAHVDVLTDLLADPESGEVDAIGVHGQTLAHAPGGRGTHQAGDGRRLANAMGYPVVWDFRSADVHLGGQGAPLAPAYHFAMTQSAGLDAPVAVLNLGGVGNFTWLDPRAAGPDADGALLAFDTGPANAPLDDHVADWLGMAYDSGGVLASEGAVDAATIAQFAEHPYFLRMPPKSLDRNDFSALVAAADTMSAADGAATLTAAVAVGVLRGVEHFPAPISRVLVTGGGRKNPVMMKMIAEALDVPVDPVESIGFDGDMVEAQAFAYLAVRVMRGLPTTFPSTTGVGAAVGGGEVSRPG